MDETVTKRISRKRTMPNYQFNKEYQRKLII